jgi:hypothetical protein
MESSSSLCSGSIATSNSTSDAPCAVVADAPRRTAAGSQHQRELTRRYKETMRPIGVYAIRNTVSGRILIGASLDVDGALNRHRFELNLKGHRNRRLLEEWLRDGAAAFRFEVVDTVKPRDDPAFDPAAELAGLLALWTEELDPRGERSYRAPRPAAPVLPRSIA